VLVLDGNQAKLRRLHWLIALFREPYSKVYAAERTADWLGEAGLEGVERRSASPSFGESLGWIQQLNWGKKPEIKFASEGSPESILYEKLCHN
jgi:hypothetical protein